MPLQEAPSHPFALAAALALFLAFAGPGIAALRRFATGFTLLECVALGGPLGLVASSLGLLGLACVFGLTVVVILPWAGFCLLITAALWRRRAVARPVTEQDRVSGGQRWALLMLGAFVLRWAFLWWGALGVDDLGLSAGFVNLWGDWAQHLGDVSSFAYGDNFPPVHPRLFGHSFAYHYLTSITVAAAVRLGVDPVVALPLHSFLLSVLLLFGLYAFARHFLVSRAAAALATALFLLGGGWGWWLPLQAAMRSPGPLQALFAHPWDGAAQEAANFRWQNIYFSLIGPQRAYLYGLPLGMLTLRILSDAVRDGRRRGFLLAGVVAGLLPLAHQGTLLCLALSTPFLVLLFPRRAWAWFFAMWLAVGLPQMVPLLRGGAGALSAFRFHLGWIAPPDPWPWFWLKNLGLFLPLAFAGFLRREGFAEGARRFLSGLMPPFIIANLFLFQPWDWDNTKLLTYWFLGVCILSAAAIASLWVRWRAPLARAGLVVALGTLVLSGVLLNLNQALGRDRHLMLNREELGLARAIRERTPPHALFAAGIRHNHPVTMLSGRRVIMGYPAWLWSQGYHYADQERDLRAILTYSPEAPRLLRRYGVDYVVMGPEERDLMGGNEAAFAARYPCVIRTANYRVYAIARGA